MSKKIKLYGSDPFVVILEVTKDKKSIFKSPPNRLNLFIVLINKNITPLFYFL